MIIDEGNGTRALVILCLMAHHESVRSADPLISKFMSANYQDLPFHKEYFQAIPQTKNAPEFKSALLQHEP